VRDRPYRRRSSLSKATDGDTNTRCADVDNVTGSTQTSLVIEPLVGVVMHLIGVFLTLCG
jgi:hypothetical protein